MKVFSGTIITVDEKRNVFKYLVEDLGRIIYVGNDLPEKYKGIEVIDIKGKALMPTFADTHSHFTSFAMLATTIKLDKAKSNKDILEILKEEDKKYPEGKTLYCNGASPKVIEGKFIEKKDIDSVVPSRTVVIISSDGHTAILNENALKKMPNKLKNIRGYDYETGIMGQEAFYEVVSHSLKVIKIKDALQAFQDALDLYVQNGIGIIGVECGMGFPMDIDIEIMRWLYQGQKNGAQVRLFIQSFDPKKALKRKIPRLGGCFETALDGSITSGDAAFIEPYEGTTSDHGVLYYTDEKLYENIKKVNNKGLQIVMHAIGDAAVLQGTRTLKKVLDENPKLDHRHGIIHASFVTQEAMQILKDYQIQVIGQPGFIEMSKDNLSFMHSMLGDRIYSAEPHNEFVNNKINFSGSSDAPISFPNPISWIHWLVNNPNFPHRLSVMDAMKICTYNGYYATFDEKERGSLEVGKIADMVVLSDDPLSVDPSELNSITVERTYLSGKEFSPSKQSAVKAILKGIFHRKAC
ncbi:MAG: N-substituted formamide deformylase precursor [Firmicutes bacterium ADurb.Bin080]|nr:MAG: N-substituted formamide deformylase precursor [Firmicutes bacterium ADurb.Bin080]